MKPSIFRPGLTLGLFVLIGAGLPWAAQAGVRCNELRLSVCAEARTSAFTTATVVWTDGAPSTDLSPPTGTFSTTTSVLHEYGTKTTTFAGFGLQAVYAGVNSRGPAFVVNYDVNAGSTGLSSVNGVARPGQASASFLNGSTSGDPLLSLGSNARAEIGISRAGVAETGTVVANYALGASNLIRPGQTGTVQTRTLSSAQSYWTDGMTFTGATAAPVSFTVSLTGILDSFGSGYYSLYAVNASGQTQTILSDFFSGASTPGNYAKTLTGSFLPVMGSTYLLNADLVLYAQTNGTGGAVAASEDFTHTAKVTSIGVPQGLSVSFQSNSPNLTGVIVPIAAVPEPAQAALLAAGLLALGGLRKRRMPR